MATSTASIVNNTFMIFDAAGLFMVERLEGRITLLDRANLAFIRTYTTPGHQPDSGVSLGGGLWLRDSATVAIIRVDINSGAVTPYSTWGRSSLTVVQGTSLLVAFAAGFVTTAAVIDVSTVSQVLLHATTFTGGKGFVTDPASSTQVLSMDLLVGSPSPIRAYSIPGLTLTGEIYQPPPDIAFGEAGQFPQATTLAGGLLAASFGFPPRTVVYERTTGTNTPDHALPTGPQPIGWRASEATLVAVDRTAITPRMQFFSVVPPTQPIGPAGEYTPIAPYRLFDSREVTPGLAGSVALGPGEAVIVPLVGVGPVPASGVDSVVVNITALTPTEPTFLTVFPSGTAMPGVSNINVAPGQLKVNAAFVKLGAGGAITIYNDQGSTAVVLDLQGYFSNATGAAGSRFNPMNPRRLLDTRSASPIPADSPRDLPVTVFEIPSNADAVMLNVTIIDPDTPNYLMVFPTGQAQPFASNLNANPGQVVPNLVVAKVGAGGHVTMGNVGGGTDVVVDVTGWWDQDRSTSAGIFVAPARPHRWMDTRESSTPVAADAYLSVLFGRRPLHAPLVPEQLGGGGAVMVNTTVLALDGGGYAQVYPGDLGSSAPLASNLNFAAGETVANLSSSRLGTDQAVNYRAEGSTTHLIMDFQGFSPIPITDQAHY